MYMILMYTVERLYFGHPLDRKVSQCERCPHFRGQNVHNPINTVEPLYSGHPWDRKVSLIERCPHFRGQNVHNPNVIQWYLSILDTLGTGKCP